MARKTSSNNFVDHYKVLKIEPDASYSEIRRAYRSLARTYHPDKNSGNRERAEAMTRRIITAHDVLIDAEKRRRFDEELNRLRRAAGKEKGVATYGEKLRRRPDDPGARSKLILHHLLNDRFEEALAMYEELAEKDTSFDLSDWLNTRDYLDSLFLLAEAYENTRQWQKALELYEKVYELERQKPVRYFLEEVKERVRDIYCKRLARRAPPEKAIDIYNKVLALGIPKKTEAYIHKKMAECFFKQDNHRRARHHLRQAFSLEPKLKGAQKIREKLGVEMRELVSVGTSR